MTLANPDHIDAKKWLTKARRRLQVPPTNRDLRKWTMLDFKLAWTLRLSLNREELLGILEIATNKRFDTRKDIDVFLSMMANHIDGMEMGE